MIIDCDTCVMKHIQCGDCVVGVLLAEASAPELGEVPEVERAAIAALTECGLLPPPRLRGAS